MILGFKTKWPDGRPTNFVEKIQACFKHEKHLDNIPKIHTFRKGNRWRVGRWIQFATGVRTPKYHCFVESQCMGVQSAEIVLMPSVGIIIWVDIDYPKDDANYIGRRLSQEQILLFAANDGFNSVEELTNWFFPNGVLNAVDGVHNRLQGQIVHFTDFKY